MTRQQSIEKVLAVAKSKIGVTENPRGSNRGKDVEEMLALCGLDGGYPWCAAFDAYCGHTALDSMWPMPLSADCDVLLAWAKKRGVLVQSNPKRGDIFLLLRPNNPNDAYHTGFITGDANKDGRPDTIEGNTNVDGSRDGYGVFSRERVDTDNMVFVRWVNMLDDTPDIVQETISPNHAKPAPLSFAVIIGSANDTSTLKIPGIVKNNQVFVSFRELLTGLFGKEAVTGGLTWDKVSTRPVWKDEVVPSVVPLYVENSTSYVGVRAAGLWLGHTTDFDAEKRTVHVEGGFFKL